MSGGNNYGYVPTSKSKFECEHGIIITILSTIDVAVLSQHLKGDILIVKLYNKSVVLENGNGEILGSVIHVNVNELRECIESGNNYSAEIVSIIGIACKVKISRD
ncbi:hypothetical protein MKD41_00280 [Lutibacter sp. A64]|uniref:hypothetical protein n=1 Tax=Lutibacter sp. A64 TaxID=2918526 RepID=UPI001F05658B|nr:hypothetical protein [Lutibacter sp. A64]UMB53934.1 hypothetical protein MKD41_00280 [Lutibacter sp. A64]